MAERYALRWDSDEEDGDVSHSASQAQPGPFGRGWGVAGQSSADTGQEPASSAPARATAKSLVMGLATDTDMDESSTPSGIPSGLKDAVFQCLKQHMSRAETEAQLVRAGVPAPAASHAWSQLQIDNPEFFQAYAVRLRVMRQMKLFNQLVSQSQHQTSGSVAAALGHMAQSARRSPPARPFSARAAAAEHWSFPPSPKLRRTASGRQPQPPHRLSALAQSLPGVSPLVSSGPAWPDFDVTDEDMAMLSEAVTSDTTPRQRFKFKPRRSTARRASVMSTASVQSSGNASASSGDSSTAEAAAAMAAASVSTPPPVPAAARGPSKRKRPGLRIVTDINAVKPRMPVATPLVTTSSTGSDGHVAAMASLSIPESSPLNHDEAAAAAAPSPSWYPFSSALPIHGQLNYAYAMTPLVSGPASSTPLVAMGMLSPSTAPAHPLDSTAAAPSLATYATGEASIPSPLPTEVRMLSEIFSPSPLRSSRVRVFTFSEET